MQMRKAVTVSALRCSRAHPPPSFPQNEAGCIATDEPARDFKSITYSLDGSRNVTMN